MNFDHADPYYLVHRTNYRDLASNADFAKDISRIALRYLRQHLGRRGLFFAADSCCAVK